MSRKTIVILVIILVLAIVTVAGYVFLKATGRFGRGSGFGFGIDFSDLGEITNALKDMPSTNPLEKVVNPFRDLYKNPFK